MVSTPAISEAPDRGKLTKARRMDCPETNMKGDECGTCLSLISERDLAQHFADELSCAIGQLLQFDIGEHSNKNNPWQEALDAIKNVLEERDYREREMEQLDHDGQL